MVSKLLNMHSNSVHDMTCDAVQFLQLMSKNIYPSLSPFQVYFDAIKTLGPHLSAMQLQIAQAQRKMREMHEWPQSKVVL